MTTIAEELQAERDALAAKGEMYRARAAINRARAGVPAEPDKPARKLPAKAKREAVSDPGAAEQRRKHYERRAGSRLVEYGTAERRTTRGSH